MPETILVLVLLNIFTAAILIIACCAGYEQCRELGVERRKAKAYEDLCDMKNREIDHLYKQHEEYLVLCEKTDGAMKEHVHKLLVLLNDDQPVEIKWHVPKKKED